MTPERDTFLTKEATMKRINEADDCEAEVPADSVEEERLRILIKMATRYHRNQPLLFWGVFN